MIIGTLLDKGAEVNANEVSAFVHRKEHYSKGIKGGVGYEGNPNTKILHYGNMLFNQMLEVPKQISLGNTDGKVTLKARVDNIYVTAISPEGKAIKLLKNTSGTFVENESQKSLDYSLSVVDLLKLGYQSGSVLTLEFSALSDRTSGKSIEKRRVTITLTD